VGGFQNSVRVGQACRGRYHAFCEGDDYWIDPLKLEKQVAFLEAHADHSMCFHDAIMIWQDKSHRPRYFNPSDLPELVTMPEMMLQTHVVPTAAIVVRSEVIRSLPEWRAKVWATDVVLRLWCTHVGKVRYFNQPLSVYRRQSTSMTMTVGQNADAVYRSARYLYTMFDQETKGQYHELVVSRLRKVSRLFLRAKLRRGLACGCRLLRPDLIWSRVRQLIGILIPGGIRGVPEGRESNAAGTS
jgi:hypothetical protein